MSEEARKAEWKRFLYDAETSGYLIRDNLPNRALFASGWDAHASHTAAIREKAEALIDAFEDARRHIGGRIQLSKVFYDVETQLTALKTALEKGNG